MPDGLDTGIAIPQRSPRLTAGKDGRHGRCNGGCLLFFTSSLERLMDDHPLTHDRWATPDDAEFCTVRFADLRKMERACLGIWAISRIVGNSANELDSTSTQPLDSWIISNLLGAVESLCDHIADVVGSVLAEPTGELQVATEQKPIH